jgi:hypothetical protein
MNENNKDYDPEDFDNIERVAEAMGDELNKKNQLANKPYHTFNIEKFKASIPYFLERKIRRKKTEAELLNEKIEWLKLQHFEPSIKKEAMDWLESKAKEIEENTRSRNQKDKHSPRAKKPELVLLAQLLNNSRFKSEDTRKEEIAEAMALISGYSKTTIKRDFSTKADKQTRIAVKNALKEMLEKIEEIKD